MYGMSQQWSFPHGLVFNTWRICSSVNLFFIVRDLLGYSLSRTLTFLWTSFWGAGHPKLAVGFYYKHFSSDLIILGMHSTL